MELTSISRGLRTAGSSLVCLVILLLSAEGHAASYAATSSFKVTHNFQSSTGVGAGGSLVCDKGNSPAKQTCYGSTYMGGEWNLGTVFAVRGDGTRYRVIATFDIFNGGFPSTQPVIGGPNGDLLYGVGSQAGSEGSGTAWCLNLTSGAVTTLFSFVSASGTTSQAPPVLSSDGATLYGITGQAGGLGKGTLWSFALATNTTSLPLTLMHNFGDGADDGATPFSPPTLSPDGTSLVGVTFAGGAAGVGAIYQRSTAPGGAYSILASFNGTNGARPQMGALTYSRDGSTVYGMAWGGGATGNGTIYALQLKDGAALRVLHSFSGTDGAMPYGGVTLSADGKTLYGITWRGGHAGMGVVFSLGTDGSSGYRVLHSFSGPDGAHPFGGVTLVNGGKRLLGIAGVGGASGGGVIFRLTL